MLDAFRRQLVGLHPDALEQFVHDWVDRKRQTYFDSHRFAGAGDMGRDVVGFCSSARHEGNWDNYQCKHYKSPVSKGVGLTELGKILYYAQQGEFTAPLHYSFRGSP